jgi:hypothetical protein
MTEEKTQTQQPNMETIHPKEEEDEECNESDKMRVQYR